MEELAEVLAVDFDDEEGIPKLKASWRWEDQEQALLSSCSSLIAIVAGDDDSRVVQFSHFSVKEFLTSPRLAAPSRDVSRYYIVLEPAHTIMAQACLSVLVLLNDRVEENEDRNRSPLVSYAARHWVAHGQFQNVASRIQNAMECLFDPEKPHFTAWVQLHNIHFAPTALALYLFAGASQPDAAPLYYAALCGFQSLVERLIVKYPHLVDARGGSYLTPAVAALAGRHFELARLLYRNGSSLDLPGIGEQSPLFSAAALGDFEMVQVLIECRADVNSQNDLGATPLIVASHGTHPRTFDIVRLLLENGANPNVRSKGGHIPLHAASRWGSPDVARLLLEYGANVDAEDGESQTAFQYALTEGRHELTKLLSEHGAKGI